MFVMIFCHTFFNHRCTKIVWFDSISLVFIIKVVIIFKWWFLTWEFWKNIGVWTLHSVSNEYSWKWLYIGFYTDFRNWNWQIQYGGQNFEKCSELDEIVPFTNFWGRWIQVCHQIFKIQIGGSNMAAKILKNVQNSMKLSRSQIFGVAESKSAIKFSKFKVADPIWWSKFWKMFRTRWNCPVHRFLGSLNPNLPLNLKNSEWRIQYDGPRFEKQEKSSMKSYIIMFLGLLNPNLLSDFQYPRLRIQYGV